MRAPGGTDSLPVRSSTAQNSFPCSHRMLQSDVQNILICPSRWMNPDRRLSVVVLRALGRSRAQSGAHSRVLWSGVGRPACAVFGSGKAPSIGLQGCDQRGLEAVVVAVLLSIFSPLLAAIWCSSRFCFGAVRCVFQQARKSFTVE
jgi:hypothetical protein